jgi:hypothetical protein
MPSLCQKCWFFDYWALDEDKQPSGGCNTNVAFPERARKYSCRQFRHLTPSENLRVLKRRLARIDSIYFRHQGFYQVNPTTKRVIESLKDALDDYFFHRDLNFPQKVDV